MLDLLPDRGDPSALETALEASWARRVHHVIRRQIKNLGVFQQDETGTQPIEVLLIFVSILVPCFIAILLLQEVLFEYLEVTTILVTSPFF